jgi:hypothetical protein
MTKISYNERSWAIDLISEINAFTKGTKKNIIRAGGEKTINTGIKRLFPDVLVYGKNSEILMGRELKMPDTPITDSAFLENAIQKANILGVNSFLLWNVDEAILYTKKWDDFSPIKSWDDLKILHLKRSEVESAVDEWRKFLHKILKDLNDFFDSGKIEKKTFIESFKDSTIIDFILNNYTTVSQSLQRAATRDAKFLAETNIWWSIAKVEYPWEIQWEILSKIILISRIDRFLFAHIIIAFFDPAKKVEEIGFNTSIEESIDVFEQISKECNFWNIFHPQLGEKYLDNETWLQIKQFNILLNDIELSAIGQPLLQDLLQNIINSSKRKIAGQYATPMFLARFLTSLTMLNKELTIHDPCCGTGTIVRSAYDLKSESAINSKKSLESIYCSDKVAFPLQMATLALTDPRNIGEIMQIYQQDCTDIRIGNEIEFKDPYSGSTIKRTYLGVDYIISNLPFIKQEDLAILNPGIKEKTKDIILNKTWELASFWQSDLYSHLPFYFWDLLKENWRIGIIISNSWLATERGREFKSLLNKFYHIESILISGKGRWFTNADVITIILILNKRQIINDVSSEEKTKFITINTELNLKDNKGIQMLVDSIMVNHPNKELLIQEYKTQDLLNLETNRTALFSDVSWLPKIEEKLLFANQLFKINRWERRGWDKMFYPASGHRIEWEYIKPVLKSSREIESLTTSADSEAFCCSMSTEELYKRWHSWAIKWIEKFEALTNKTWKPLPKVLIRTGCHRYEMKDNTMADFVASMNFHKRIFIAKLEQRSFVNKDSQDLQ